MKADPPLPRFFELLLRCYPRHIASQHRLELRAMFETCIRRERVRLGPAGVLYAWLRLAVDAVVGGALMRRDARRGRRIAALHTQPSFARGTSMDRLWQDVKDAARAMRRAPVFTAIVVLTLALTIGATTAMFTVVNAVLLRSLPFREPGRLVMVREGFGQSSGSHGGFSAPDYLAFEQRATFFESLAVYRNREYELSGIATPERIMTLRASASLFETLGVLPAVGRAYTRDEDASRAPVAVISDALWQRHFARDPAVVGRTLSLDRRPYTIVGVMPRGFVFPHRGPQLNNARADVYLPISFTARERAAFGSMYANSVIGRLKPDVSPIQANADSAALVQANAQELYPADLRGLAEALSGSAAPLADEIVGRVRTLLMVAFGAVVIVLLIACADIASLMLTRAAGRDREMAVRSALGASRWRLVRQLLVESGVMAFCGGVLGLLVAQAVASAIVAWAPPTLPRLHEIGLDGRVLTFVAGVSALTAVLCGLLPALELSSRETGAVLKDDARTGTAGTRQRRIFTTLVTAQMTLAVVLLVGGGLLVRSFARLVAVDPGFRGERVVTFGTSLPASGYPAGTDVRTLYTRLFDAVSATPGIAAAGLATDLPLGVRDRRAFVIDNEPAMAKGLSHALAPQWVFGEYFAALGIPLKRGRVFTMQDTAASEPVVIVNETLARTFWGDADPVGERMAWGTGPDNRGAWMRIVGVVGDVKHSGLDVQTIPQAYNPWLQVSDAFLAENVVGMMRSLKLAIRAEKDPATVVGAVRELVHAIDPALPVNVQTMDEIVHTSIATQRFNTTLLGLFALLALLLAAIGLGGVLATSVSQRTKEIGLRLALGAQHGSLVRMVVRQGMLPALIGLGIGLFLALRLVTPAMSTLLFEIEPMDALTCVAAGVLLIVVAMTACAIPAWRATRIDPMVTLRRD